MGINVLINTRCLMHPTTGVERYTGEIAARLGMGTRRISPDVRQAKPGRACTLLGRGAGGLAGHLWEQLVLPGKLRPGEVLWSPANTGPLAVSNQVLTLHDLSVIDHPEWFSAGFAAWYTCLLPRLIRKVKRVITVSQFSRERILATFDLPPEQITVIYPGVDTSQFKPQPAGQVERVRRRYRLPERYVLCVATGEPRKNLPGLLHAWQKAQSNDRFMVGTELVIAGGQGRIFRQPSEGFKAESRDEGHGVRWLGYVPDADLPALYTGALVFVYPSLYEGFGLPVLEAMACGTPVITAGDTALPEVTGDAAFLVDPTHMDDLAAAILRLLANEELRKELICRGLDRAGSFSFERTASEVWNVLQQFAN